MQNWSWNLRFIARHKVELVEMSWTSCSLQFTNCCSVKDWKVNLGAFFVTFTHWEWDQGPKLETKHRARWASHLPVAQQQCRGPQCCKTMLQWEIAVHELSRASALQCPVVHVQGHRTNILPLYSNTPCTKGELNTFQKLWTILKRGLGGQV